MNCYCFEDIEIGHQEVFSVIVSDSMMEQFMNITSDINPLHTDDNYSKLLGFEKRVVYGMLTASFLSTLAGVYLPGKYSLIHTVSVDFVKPVRIGDTLTVKGIVKEKNDSFKYIMLKVEIRNQNDEKVLRGKMRIGFTNEHKEEI